MLQPINTDFSRSIGTLMGQAQEGIGSIGRVANDYLLKKERQDAIDYQRGRDAKADADLKVQQDRATQLWNEQQAEKQKIEYANLISSANKDTLAAQTNEGYNKALDAWRAGGMITPSPVIQDYPMILNQGQNVDISVKQPSISGSSGSYTLRGARVPAGTNLSNQMLPQQPNTSTTVFDPTKPVVASNSTDTSVPTKDYTNVIPETIGKLLSGGTHYTPPSATVAGNIMYGVKNAYNTVKDSVLQQYNTTYSNGNPDARFTPPDNAGSVKAPLILQTNKPGIPATTVVAPTNNTIGVQTQTPPSQQNTSNTTIPTTRSVSGTSTAMPNMVQINPAILDKIFGSIDPNAQKRRDSREMLESMYYSLGLSPKQVKEYTDGAAESIYGDANDPIKIARANAQVSGYEKNASTINTANLEGWKVNQDNAIKLAMKEGERAKVARDPIAEAQAKFLIDHGLPLDTPAAKVKIWMNEDFAEMNQKRAADLKKAQSDADAAAFKVKKDTHDALPWYKRISD